MVPLISLLITAEKFSRRNSENLLVSKNGKSDEIVRFIEKNLFENLSYKTIAEKFYMSEKNLYKFFKKETCFTLGDYITERRIIKAQSVLSSGGSAGDAAILSEFSDYSVFYGNFLKKVGVSPTKYIENSVENE